RGCSSRDARSCIVFGRRIARPLSVDQADSITISVSRRGAPHHELHHISVRVPLGGLAIREEVAHNILMRSQVLKADRHQGVARSPGDVGPGTGQKGERRMRKGITLRVKVYIEGDAAPVEDFSKIGQQVIQKVLDAGIKAAAAPYTVAVKRMEPLEG